MNAFLLLRPWRTDPKAEAERQQLKSLLLDGIRQLSQQQQPSRITQSILETLIQSIVHIARIQWPQGWPELHRQLWDMVAGDLQHLLEAKIPSQINTSPIADAPLQCLSILLGNQGQRKLLMQRKAFGEAGLQLTPLLMKFWHDLFQKIYSQLENLVQQSESSAAGHSPPPQRVQF